MLPARLVRGEVCVRRREREAFSWLGSGAGPQHLEGCSPSCLRIDLALGLEASLCVQRARLRQSDTIGGTEGHRLRLPLPLVAVVPISPIRCIDDEPKTVTVRQLSGVAGAINHRWCEPVPDPLPDPCPRHDAASSFI